MADIESEEDSDVEQTSNDQKKNKKQNYTHKTREISNPKKKKPNDEQIEFDSDDSDEAYINMLKGDEKSDGEEENEFERQLRLEKEEAIRLQIEKESKKTKVDPDGTEYEWDPNVKGWFPKIPDKQFIEYLSNNYKNTEPTNQYNTKLLENTYYLFNGAFYKWDFENNKWLDADTAVYAYVDYCTGISFEWNQEANEWKEKNQPAAAMPTTSGAKEEIAKSSNQTTTSEKTEEQTSKKTVKKREGWVDVDEDKNTNVYVSGLPLDITDEEFEEMMSKYGIIMKDPLTHKLKIKIYKDVENNEAKGDGRCCYLMPESVKLCLQLLDGSLYKGHTIKVEKAKFVQKGNFDPSKSGISENQRKKLNKKKEKKLLDKQRQRLLDWEDRPDIKREKHEKVVVIKGLFVKDDINKDPGFSKKLKNDLKAELETYGEVKKILIHENNPEGVATVSFKEVDMADECCQYLNNRVWKTGKVISCETWNGETKYDVEETDEERDKRLSEWHKFLESE